MLIDYTFLLIFINYSKVASKSLLEQVQVQDRAVIITHTQPMHLKLA